MKDQSMRFSTQKNSKYYWLYRINIDAIRITKEQRDFILEAKKRGLESVEVGDHFIALSAISSIDPEPEPVDVVQHYRELMPPKEQEFVPNFKLMEDVKAKFLAKTRGSNL